MKKKRNRLLPKLLLLLALLALLGALLFAFARNGGQHSGENDTSATVSGEEKEDEATLNKEETKTSSEGEIKASSSEKKKKTSYLTLTDEQIHTGDLILVSSKYAYDFDANADSIDLVNIKDAQTFSYPVDKDDFQISSRVMDQMDKMIKACDDAVGTDSHSMSISSAYRSKEYQQNVWDEAVQTNGEEYAKQYVAVPGYSEHHTGLAVDFGITNTDGTAGSFSGSQNAEWMDENSWRYGFVRRYPTEKVDITGISNESWHFRFVGVPHAKLMTQKGFVLEEYLDYLKENTSALSPAEITADHITYHIWYTNETKIEEPSNPYTISGNNVDGYIITEQVDSED